MSTKRLFHFLFVAVMSASMCLTASHGALSSSQSEALYQQMLKDPEFKAADRELSSVYTQVRQGLDAAAQLLLRDQQRQWLKMKDDALSQSEPGKRTQLALRLTLERIRELRGQAQAGARGTAPVEKADDKNVNIGAQLAKLKSPDPDARLEALRSLEYSLDPRLPEVMLGLLRDRGDTIRRVAAHGIGSRWWQISKPQVNTFIAGLREAEKTEGDGLTEECHRSINLLLQAVGKSIEFPDAVSVSPNGRWIIYDRLGTPCLVDVKAQTEELIGWEGRDTREGRFQGGAKWHPSKEIAVMDFSTRRGPAVIAVWIHGKGVKLIHKSEFLEMLEKRKLKMSSMSTSIDIQDMKWSGDKLLIPVSFEELKREKSMTAAFTLDLARMTLTLDGVK